MATLSDREIVKQIQQQVSSRKRNAHNWSESCEYDAEGRLLSLDLSGLNLSSVLSEFGQLSSLAMLELGGNQLTSLPPEFRQLSSLELVSLYNNPNLHIPPPKIVARGLPAIRAYFKNL